MSAKETRDPLDLFRAIDYTWLHLRQRGKRMLADLHYDLTFEQAFVLNNLNEEEGLQVGVLAERADRERTTMSRMIDGLERRNLVVRVPDKHDRRQKLVYLTKLGRKRVAEMPPLVSKLAAMILIRRRPTPSPKRMSL